jgi:hypothetical protein
LQNLSPAARQAALDRANRPAKGLSSLGIVHALDIHQDDRFAVIRREPVYAAVDRLDRLLLFDPLFWRKVFLRVEGDDIQVVGIFPGIVMVVQ